MDKQVYDKITQEAHDIIKDIEFEIVYHSCTGDDNERRAKSPLMTDKQISMIMWNLLSSNNFRERLSGQIYDQICTILFNRIRNIEYKPIIVVEKVIEKPKQKKVEKKVKEPKKPKKVEIKEPQKISNKLQHKSVDVAVTADVLKR